MEERAELLIIDKLNLLLLQLENTAVTAYLVKEGILYADAEAEMSAKSVELLAQVLDKEVAALKEIKNLILQKDDQEV